MKLLCACVTDLVSLEAVISVLRERDPDLKSIKLPHELWIKIIQCYANQIEWKSNKSLEFVPTYAGVVILCEEDE